MLEIFKRPDYFRKNRYYYATIAVWTVVAIVALAFKFNSQTCSMGLNWVILLSIWHPILDITSRLLNRTHSGTLEDRPTLKKVIIMLEFISYILWITTFFFMATFVFYPSDCKQNAPIFYILGTIYTWFCLVLAMLFIINTLYVWWTSPTPADRNRERMGTEVEGMPTTREVSV